LELYGNSGRISTSTVDFDVTYKETEGGVEKTFTASFNDQGVLYGSPFITHSGVPNIEQTIIMHRNTYKYLNLTVGTGIAFDPVGKGIQSRTITIIGPTDINFLS
jgi:hypothetical protein